MNKDKFLQTGLLEQYILGLTDEEETAVVKQYAETFPEVQAEIDQMREAMDQYAKQYAVMPPEELKARVMQGVDRADQRSDRDAASPGPSPSGTNWLGAILLTVLAGASVFLYKSKTSAELELASLESRYALFQDECEREKAALRQQQQVFATLKHEATVPVRLQATSLNPNAQAVAYLNGLEKVAYINTGMLPELPAGKTYQLWADVEGEMINMGVLNHHADGLQAVTYIDHAESLNITIEPQGGSTAPTVAQLIVNGEV
ncbi:MAG: anti-sigma factor [Phaeodactylibacter sp.]|uniref:anti-sigma factor n=1 Tax=Phaeodactylibacter sp. TaxID=1940289 RepID=UPI0032EBB977